jgi:DNA-binding NarL/FixJ family response regulator
MRRMSATNPAKSSRSKILIVDDHAYVRQGLREFIGREDDLVVCGDAEGRTEALKLCAEVSPHLVLIDLSLGGESGIDLVKDIAIQFPKIKMIVLSMQDEMLYAERVLRIGALGYVNKSDHPGQLIDAIRCVLGGGVYASEAVKQRIMQTMRHVDAGGDPIGSLSDRELTVFEKIGQGQGTADIAESMNLSIKTVETYRSRIKTKLGVDSSTELLQRAVQWILGQKV